MARGEDLRPIEERYFDLFRGADFKGLGRDKCRACGQPTRDHRIGPCPFLGMDVIPSVHEAGVTDRSRWRNGEPMAKRDRGIPQVRINGRSNR